MTQRFCGQGRKWCGKICIASNQTCRKAKASTMKATYAKRRALKKRKIAFGNKDI